MAPLLIGLVLINLISLGIIAAFVANETEILPHASGHSVRATPTRARRWLRRAKARLVARSRLHGA